MASWPGTLPSAALLEGAGYAPRSQSIVTEMELGPPKARRRTSTDVIDFQAALILTGTELAALKTFYYTTLSGGSDTFTWTDPTDGSTETFLFRSAPTYRPIYGHGTATSRLWAVTLDLVVQR